MLGYLAIGLPCGIMESKVGFSPLMSFVLSMTFYSGAGQFMIPSMWLAGSPLYSVIASVSFVNTRQMLYSAAFSPYFSDVSRPLAFFFSATVTDESFGVSLDKFVTDEAWTPRRALLVNLMSMTSWGVANTVGTALGPVLNLPVAVTSFAMTSIFVCLLVGQPLNRTTAVVVCVAFSIFISASAKYPLVYGSLASVILLMFWLYTCCLMIYCGAVFNITIRNIKSREAE